MAQGMVHFFPEMADIPQGQPAQKSNEKPFLDLAAIDERSLAEAARKVVEDLKREGKLPPPAKHDPQEDVEFEKTLRELFGEPIPRKK